MSQRSCRRSASLTRAPSIIQSSLASPAIESSFPPPGNRYQPKKLQARKPGSTSQHLVGGTMDPGFRRDDDWGWDGDIGRDDVWDGMTMWGGAAAGPLASSLPRSRGAEGEDEGEAHGD